MADTIGVMNAGRLEQAGPPEELYVRPRTRFVAGFLGAVNWINRWFDPAGPMSSDAIGTAFADYLVGGLTRANPTR